MRRSALALAVLVFTTATALAEEETKGDPAERTLERRRPGDVPPSAPEGYEAPAPASPHEILAISDRWRLVESLGVHDRWWNPYQQNTLKGDRPIIGEDWFINLLAVSDSVFETRRVPTPQGVQATGSGGSLDAFGDDEQLLLNQNLILSASLIKGDTVFRPPDWELRLTGVQNWNYSVAEVVGLLDADPRRGRRRYDHHFGIQDLFVDRHLHNKSDRFDFDSVRVGVQPFISDFRGFLLQDNLPGARLFGNFLNNRVQYNLGVFRRMEKDTNSGLNEWNLRSDEIWAANAYVQDLPVLGFTLQGTVIHNRNNEENKRHFDHNNFLQRPASLGDERGKHYRVTYFGLNGDGHFDRVNVTFAFYYAHGRQSHDPLAQQRTAVEAFFGALESSIDFNWYRLKAYALWASGDAEPLDDTARGFDAIFENPQFAGADTSFWQRQAIPFIGGGGVILSGRNALLPSLRSSKEHGQSSFVNPGLRMAGVGADFDILPELRLVLNLSTLHFDATAPLRILRNQGPIERHIGEDLSAALVYRPWFIQNVVLRLSGAVLIPGDGFEQLFDDRSKDHYYSVLANAVLTY